MDLATLDGRLQLSSMEDSMHFLTTSVVRAVRAARPSLAGLSAAILLASASTAQEQARRPDGLYAEIRTSKGRIVARLEADLTPLTVANFVGLAEGTIANSAFDPGRPFYDGSTFHRVEAGHVIQTGIPQSERARNPGYTFPNEIHAKLSHNHAGALNMANGGPNTNAAQFCITLGDRSYLDGDYTVFGEVVEGLDVVMRIERGDVVDSVRIARIGAKAETFRPTAESFRAMVKEAEQRVAEHTEKKRLAEQDWIARNYPKATGPSGGVLTERLAAGQPSTSQAASTGGGLLRVRYSGSEIRYVGNVLGRNGPPLEVIPFGSGENGVPGFVDPPRVFPIEPGKTKINSGLDIVIANMQPGERRVVIVPAALGYGRAGLYPPETMGKRRLAISPNALLVYDVEVLGNE
jgi:peptidylprolyl isomerase